MQKPAPRRFYFVLCGLVSYFSRKDKVNIKSDVQDVLSTQMLVGLEQLKTCLTKVVIFLKRVMGNSVDVVIYTNFLTDTLLVIQNIYTKDQYTQMYTNFLQKMKYLMSQGEEITLAAMYFWGTEVEKEIQLKNWIKHLHRQIDQEHRSLISIKDPIAAESPSRKVFLLTFSNGTRSFLNEEEMKDQFPAQFAAHASFENE